MKYTIDWRNVNHEEEESQALATMFCLNDVSSDRVSMRHGIDFDTRKKTVRYFLYKHNSEGNVLYDFATDKPLGEWHTLTPKPETWEF